MALSITNQTLTISLIEGAVTTVIRKDNLKVQAFGDVVRLTDYSGVIYEFLYTDCTSPSEASANDLRDAINVFLITATGGGGGGSVNSVNAGINISVTGTATDPIINSLSDRYKTTSTTSNSVSNGSKSFTIGTNLSYIPLQEILIVYDVSNHMHGEVTSYNSSTGALVVDIKHHTGSGTYTAWVLNLDGTPVDALTGTGTANEIAYFTAARVLASLPVATYPSLTELSYVKGLTSAIQTQLNGKFPNPVGTILQFIRGDGSLALIPSFPVAAKFYQQDNWSAVGLGNNSIEYVASLNKIYVTNISSNSVTILNSTTGEPIATVAATNCVKCKYIASINQIYVTSSSVTSIIRIDGTTNLPLAAISVGVTVNGLDILEYSATKVFITCSAGSGSIMVVNPLLGTVAATVTTSVPSFPFGMALNTNSLSSQFDKIVIAAQSGICIFDPTTNAVSTTVANPSSAISSAAFLTYSSIDDKYYVASAGNGRLVVLSIATATTFTATFLSNQQALRNVVIDETNDYLFMFPLWSSGGTNIASKMFKKTTLEPIVSITPLSQGGAASSSGLGVIDLANSRIFVVGRSASLGNVSILKYV